MRNSADTRAVDEECGEDGRPDVNAIMGRIRARTLAAQQGAAGIPRYVPPSATLFDGSVSPLLYSDELNHLNAEWGSWAEPEPISSHRPIIGPIIVRIKTKLRQFLVESLLKSYFEKERAFQAQLVRHLNASARYIDARDSALFWQLVHKMDSDIAAINERCDRLYTQAIAEAERAGRDTESALSIQRRELEALQAEAARLGESLLMLAGRQAETVPGAGSVVGPGAGPGAAIDKLVQGELLDTLEPRTGGVTLLVGPLGEQIRGSLEARGAEVSVSERFEDTQGSFKQLLLDLRGTALPVERLLELLSERLQEHGRLVLVGFDLDTIEGQISAVSSGSVGGCSLSRLRRLLLERGFELEDRPRRLLPLEQIGTQYPLPARWSTLVSGLNRNFARLNQRLYAGPAFICTARAPERTSL